MWFLFQGFIVFAVCASNLSYHWTPNSYIVGLAAGMGLAWSLTWLFLPACRCQAKSNRGHHRPKFISDRLFADPDAAARKLVDIANAAEAVPDGRMIYDTMYGP